MADGYLGLPHFSTPQSYDPRTAICHPQIRCGSVIRSPQTAPLFHFPQNPWAKSTDRWWGSGTNQPMVIYQWVLVGFGVYIGKMWIYNQP